MIIDAHCHYYTDEDYINRLLHTMDDAGIDMSVLTPLPPQFEAPQEEAVMAAAKEHGDRLIPWGYIQLGFDTPKKVTMLFEEGFKGIKIHIPFKNYNDESFFPVYAKIEEYGMPILFHTGMIVARTLLDKKYKVDSSRMRPVFLDAVAKAFPKLNMIAAHLGSPWHLEAATVSHINPNIYLDLAMGEHSPLDREPVAVKKYLYWPDSFKKLVFGGSWYGHSKWILERRYLDLFKFFNTDKKTREMVLSGNIKKMMGIS